MTEPVDAIRHGGLVVVALLGLYLAARRGSGATMAAAVAREVGMSDAEPGTKQNPLVPLAAVARRLGVSKKTVGRRIRRGELRGAQWVGGKVCLPEAEVLSYLRRERARPMTLVRS